MLLEKVKSNKQEARQEMEGLQGQLAQAVSHNTALETRVAWLEGLLGCSNPLAATYLMDLLKFCWQIPEDAPEHLKHVAHASACVSLLLVKIVCSCAMFYLVGFADKVDMNGWTLMRAF